MNYRHSNISSWMAISAIQINNVASYVTHSRDWSIAMSVSVCLYVYLSTHISRKWRPNFTKFSVLPLAVAPSSSDDDAICYVFPVFEDDIMFAIRRVAKRAYSHNAASEVSADSILLLIGLLRMLKVTQQGAEPGAYQICDVCHCLVGISDISHCE